MPAPVEERVYGRPIHLADNNVLPSLKALNWKRLFSYLKPYLGRMALATIALLISMGFGLAFPLVITRLLDSVTHPNSGSSLNRLALSLIGIFLAQAAFSFIQSYWLAAIGEHIVYDLRTGLYGQLQSMSLDFFARHRIGELVSRLNNDVIQMREMLTSSLASSLSQIVSLVGAVVIVLLINPHLTLFTFAVMPVVILVAIVFGSRIQRGSARVQDELARSTVAVEEALQGIREVKSFGREEYEVRRFAVSAQAALHASIRQAVYNSSFGSVMIFLGFGSIGAITWYGGHEVVAGRLSLALITGFLIYGVMIASNLASLAGLYGRLRSAVGGVQRVFEMLDFRPSVQDSAQALTISTVNRGITFEDVSFGYEENTPVLEQISLDIHAGEILALVGPSGAGKSTVFNLIPRFYDPTSGRVQIDGLDLRSITQSSLRAQIAIVPQETILFGGTIRENILYGRLGATDVEMKTAAKAANAHDFIMELPKRYETTIGERGAKLSGGQRQRIAVTRAILKDPRVLLLDEATSSLDSESEHLVQEALDQLMRNRTTIIIAHRLSTIKAAHRIAVLDRGHITELGSHDELMKLDGLYARLYMMQFHDPTKDDFGCRAFQR